MDRGVTLHPKPTRNLTVFIGLILQKIGRFSYKSLFKITLLLLSFLLQLVKFITQSFNLVGLSLVKLYRLLVLKLETKINFPVPKLPPLALKRPRLKPLFLVFSLLIFISGNLFYYFILKDLPSPSDLASRQPSLSTKIYDRNGQLLFTFFKDQNRTLINLDDIPEHFKLATLAIEDNDFYKHNGFSYRGILRSLRQIIFNQELQGGSTITQQLVKNALLTPERTVTRKLKELVLAIEVELLFEKDEILEMYFNEVSYGGVAFGAQQAAQTYFDKPVRDVNLAEAALLAGLPAAPTTYSPFGANPYLAVTRQRQVLDRLVEEQYIAPLEAELAKQQKIKLAPQYTNIKAPHFVMYVKNLLVQEFGQAVVEQGGLTVTTSLDLDLQNQAQTIVTEEISKVFPLKITNGAALITNPKTGEILAMVGSRNYFDTDRDGQVNVTLRPRQPGSAIKPVNYAVALQNGYTSASIIHDSPVTYDILGSKAYSPVNYDNRFHGQVSLRTALANSYNIPAVKVLASYGVDKMINMGQQLGITTWNEPHRYGLSLTLGGAEVKMVDMAVVYGTLANLGLKVDLHPILKVTDSRGKTLLDFNCDPIQTISLPEPAKAATLHLSCNPDPILDNKLAFILTDILSDQVARIPAFGSRTLLNIPNHQVAVKTGTTNDKRDNWAIGYTTDFLVAAWVGNNDNSPMSQVASGVTGASPIWHNLMLEVLKTKSPHQFTPPPNLKTTPICTLTGQLGCSGCPNRDEYFLPGTEPKKHCSTEIIDQIIKQEQDKQQDQILTGASAISLP